MSEYWSDFEARINWLQMYERTIHIDVEKSDCADECNEGQTQVTSPRDLGLASPAIKRRRSVKVQKRSVECEQCECVVQLELENFSRIAWKLAAKNQNFGKKNQNFGEKNKILVKNQNFG